MIEAQYQTCLRSLPCCCKDRSRVVNDTCANPCNTIGWVILWHGLRPAVSASPAVSPPLPRCCFRAPLVGQVMWINLLLNFICGFVVVPVSCLCQLTQKAKPRIVIINNHSTTCAGSNCFSTFLLHGWVARWYILKPSLFEENWKLWLCTVQHWTVNSSALGADWQVA